MCVRCLREISALTTARDNSLSIFILFDTEIRHIQRLQRIRDWVYEKLLDEKYKTIVIYAE